MPFHLSWQKKRGNKLIPNLPHAASLGSIQASYSVSITWSRVW